MPVLVAVLSSNIFLGFSSYSLLMASVFAFLRSSFSFSIYSTVFLNKFFGIGFAFVSRSKAIGGGTTLGFGFVRLNGTCSVTFLGAGPSNAASDLSNFEAVFV